jgi:hypothetical protein
MPYAQHTERSHQGLRRASAECRAKVALSWDPFLDAELLDMEQRSLNIAMSYAFLGDLEKYLLELHNNQIPSDPAEEPARPSPLS